MGQPQRIFDSLAYAKQLKEAGVDEKQATVHAETLFNVLDNQLITEQDMHKIEIQLKDFRAETEIQLKDLRAETEIRLKDLSAEIQKLDFKINDVETRLSHDIKTIKYEIIVALGSLMVILSGLMAGLFKIMH